MENLSEKSGERIDKDLIWAPFKIECEGDDSLLNRWYSLKENFDRFEVWFDCADNFMIEYEKDREI